MATSGADSSSSIQSASISHTRKQKSKPDPFLELTPPKDGYEDSFRELPEQSLVKKIVMTPLICVSFILSLFLVERRNRSYRASEHSPANAAHGFWSAVSLRNWLDPEPYQDPSDSTWGDANDGAAGNQNSQPGKTKWFTRKKHRKMAKLQLSDAFDMSGTVMLYLIGAFIVSTVAIWLGFKKAFGSGI